MSDPSLLNSLPPQEEVSLLPDSEEPSHTDLPDITLADPPDATATGPHPDDAGQADAQPAQAQRTPDTGRESPGASPEEAGKPFLVQLHRLDEAPNGSFRPGAVLQLNPVLRTSGLLRLLPAEDLKNLLFLFTFLTPNGSIQPAVQQLADAMQVSESKVRSRMQRLTEFLWQGQPLVQLFPRESGLDAYAPSPTLYTIRQADPGPQPYTYVAAGRDVIIAQSREKYARPRAEVERMIAAQMGWSDPSLTSENPPEGLSEEEKARWSVRRRLLLLGLSKELTDALLMRFPLEQIQQQLDWLPYRNARVPASYLISALEGRFEAPVAVRLQRMDQAVASTADLPTSEEQATSDSANGPLSRDESDPQA